MVAIFAHLELTTPVLVFRPSSLSDTQHVQAVCYGSRLRQLLRNFNLDG